jgi:hypothetical protein
MCGNYKLIRGELRNSCNIQEGTGHLDFLVEETPWTHGNDILEPT